MLCNRLCARNRCVSYASIFFVLVPAPLLTEYEHKSYCRKKRFLVLRVNYRPFSRSSLFTSWSLLRPRKVYRNCIRWRMKVFLLLCPHCLVQIQPSHRLPQFGYVCSFVVICDFSRIMLFPFLSRHMLVFCLRFFSNMRILSFVLVIWIVSLFTLRAF